MNLTEKEKILTEINDTIQKMRNELFDLQGRESAPSQYDSLARNIKCMADNLKDLAYNLKEVRS